MLQQEKNLYDNSIYNGSVTIDQNQFMCQRYTMETSLLCNYWLFGSLSYSFSKHWSLFMKEEWGPNKESVFFSRLRVCPVLIFVKFPFRHIGVNIHSRVLHTHIQTQCRTCFYVFCRCFAIFLFLIFQEYL